MHAGDRRKPSVTLRRARRTAEPPEWPASTASIAARSHVDEVKSMSERSRQDRPQAAESTLARAASRSGRRARMRSRSSGGRSETTAIVSSVVCTKRTETQFSSSLYPPVPLFFRPPVRLYLLPSRGQYFSPFLSDSNCTTFLLLFYVLNHVYFSAMKLQKCYCQTWMR